MCKRSPLVEPVLAAPGNGATHAVGAHLTIDPEDPGEVLAAVHEYDIDLTVIGPDNVVAAGVADQLSRAGGGVCARGSPPPPPAPSRLRASRATTPAAATSRWWSKPMALPWARA